MAFPNVPTAPGVPALPRAPGAVPTVLQLLSADALSLLSGSVEPSWGLFLNGVPVVTAESVVSFDFKKGSSIATFPIENGGFESYNKVQRPFDVRLRFATGAGPAERQALLESAAAAVASLDLMDAVSPGATYENVNPVDYSYRRTSTNGVGLLQVDIFCEEVRVRAASTFTSSSSATTAASTSGTSGNTSADGGGGVTATTAGGGSFNDRFSAAGSIFEPKSPGAAPLVSGGVVQTTPASPGQFDLSQALP